MPRKASEYTHVTTVLSWVDSNWYQYWLKSLDKKTEHPVKEAERISRESAAFGTSVHKIVEQYLRGIDVGEHWLDNREYTCAGTLIKWLKETNARPYLIDVRDDVGLEYEVKSKKLGLIGHFDALLKIGDTLWMADFKTSNAIKKGQFLQLAAYAKMLEEEYGLDVNQGVILRVDKDPNKMPQFESKEVHDLKGTYWPIFKKALEVYNYFNGKKEWRKT